MKGAIVYRAPRPTLAVAAQNRFWRLPWVTNHIHSWTMLRSYAICSGCSAAVGVIESRDEAGGRDAQ